MLEIETRGLETFESRSISRPYRSVGYIPVSSYTSFQALLPYLSSCAYILLSE